MRGLQGMFQRMNNWWNTPLGNSQFTRGDLTTGLLFGPSSFLSGPAIRGAQEGLSNLFGYGRGAPMPQWTNPDYNRAVMSGPPGPSVPGYVAPDFSGLMPRDPQQQDPTLYGNGQGMMRPPAPRGPTPEQIRNQQEMAFMTSQINQNRSRGIQQAREAMNNMFRGAEQ